MAISEEKQLEYRQTAVIHFQVSLSIRHLISDEVGAASTLAELGKMLSNVGRIKEAVAALNEALSTFRKLDDWVKVAIILETMGGIHEQQRQYMAALTKYQEALTLYQQYSSPQEVARCQRNITLVEAKLNGV